MSTTTTITFESSGRERIVNHCKIKRRNHLGGKELTPDLRLHDSSSFAWQYGDLYDYDDGYAFLCAKGESPNGGLGSPMILPSRWNKTSRRTSALELKKFERKFNTNSNIFEGHNEPESSWKLKTNRNSSGNGSPREERLLSSDIDDDYQIELATTETKSSWIDKTERSVDYCTCMFCVRGIFYNFVEDEDDCSSLPDSPCRCTDPGISCTKRWSLLALLACFLPCLVFYPPLHGCIALCKKCRKRKKSKRKEVKARISKQKSKVETDV